MKELQLTESSACRRIAAARLLARFPQIASYLLASRITLMGLVGLKDVLDDSNVAELLERASGLSEPDVRQLVMRIRFGAAASLPTVRAASGQLAPATPAAAIVAADPVATSKVEPPEDLQPVTLWVGREFCEELEAVRTLLGHAVPSGKREEVLLYVLRAQRKVLDRRRHGSPKPASQSTAGSSANAHYIPAAVRREVHDRERGTCAYVGEGNRRCCSKLRLEYQHIVPVARGGPSTPENLTLFCCAHNLLQAEKDFGVEHVKQKQLERSAADALVRLGYKRAQAERVVGVAIEELPDGSDLKALLQKSLQILAS